tara:strand:+ start:29 stop:271 length:243 start_codon:yes stop_codon:yes gene_type:complete
LVKTARGFILEELDIEDILNMYKVYQKDSDMLLQVAIWALANHPHSIEKELGISTQYRKRLEQVVVKIFVPEMPEKEYLN